MDKRNILITLWLLCTIGMILHFNYHIGELFYGIDITKPNANGEVPISVFIIRTIFYHLPFIWILLIMYYDSKFFKITFFIISSLYTLAHLGHFIGEIRNVSPNISQISLLFIVLVTSLLLAFEHFKYWKQDK